MSDILDAFRARLYADWLPAFCHAPRRNYSVEGFRAASLATLEAFDAGWFIEAMDRRLVVQEAGAFRAPASVVAEQLFWELDKSIQPRPITLSRETIITAGAVARLHVQYDWPARALGMQSRRRWAFDLVGYGADGTRELLLCEVKKSARETDKLRDWMLEYCSTDPLTDEPVKGDRLNAYRKVQDIRIAWPERVWLLGPGGRGFVYRVERAGSSLRFNLLPEPESHLAYAGFAGG